MELPINCYATAHIFMCRSQYVWYTYAVDDIFIQVKTKRNYVLWYLTRTFLFHSPNRR